MQALQRVSCIVRLVSRIRRAETLIESADGARSKDPAGKVVDSTCMFRDSVLLTELSCIATAALLVPASTQIGVGTSSLQVGMADDGFRSVLNIDVSQARPQLGLLLSE